jgi:hypothetical protein
MAIARSVPVNGRHRPSHVVPGAPRRSLCPAGVRNRLLGFPRHRGQIVICAASDKDGPKQPETTTPLIKAVRQLAGATAFAAVTVSNLTACCGSAPVVQGSVLHSHASSFECLVHAIDAGCDISSLF